MAMCSAYRHEGWSTFACSREATGELDGKPLCGPHLAGARRSKAVRAKRDEKWNANEKASDRARAVASELSEEAGFQIRPHYYPYPRSTYSEEWVEIGIEDLRRLLERD